MVANSNLRSASVARPQGEDVGRGPFIFLMIYLAVEYVRPQYFIPAIGVFRPGLVLGIGMALYWIKVWGPKAAFSDTMFRYYLFILVFVVLWVPFARNNFWAFQRAEALTTYFIGVTVPIALALRDTRRFHKFISYWIVIHVYLAIFGLTHAGRGPGSFLSDENDLALALGMCLPFPFLFSQLKKNTLWQRYLYIGAALIMILGIVWTNSRGGFIGLVCVTIYMLWLSKNRVRNLFILIILGLATIVVAPDSYIDEIQSISDTEDSTRNKRILHWRVGWTMFVDNPVLGVGPGNYAWNSSIYQRELDDYQPGDQMFGGRAAHSLYFTALPEFGLVGVVPYVIILFSMLGRLRRFERGELPASDGIPDEKSLMIARALRASLIGYLSAGAFISVLYYPQFWYTIGLVVALCGFQGAKQRKKPLASPTR